MLGSLAVGAVLIVAMAASAAAEGTFDIPAGAHFNPQKLERVGDFLHEEIAAGKIPGAILLIQQHGEPVYHRALGVRDVTTQLPMTDDTIFRVFSMSKPITSVVAMMLIEEGKLSLDDTVAKYISSFADIKVGVEQIAADGSKTLELVPPKRPMTVHDLMRHTSGIPYGFYGDSLVRRAYAAAKIFDGDFDNAGFAERIAKLPLQDQPGTVWDYGHSTDVLGRVMEIVSGQSLLALERDKLLDPLGMTSTAFYITDPAKRKLIAVPMPSDSDFRIGFIGYADAPTRWESGGGGMISTMSDMARFAQMVLDGGTSGARQYLSPKTFKEMTTDRVGPGTAVGRDFYYFPGDGFGFGLGFGLRTDHGVLNPPAPGSLGELKWDGAGGCYLVVDRAQDMFFVLLEETPSERHKIQPMVKRLIYEALEN